MYDPFELNQSLLIQEVEMKEPKKKRVKLEEERKIQKPKAPRLTTSSKPKKETSPDKKLKRLTMSHKHSNMIRPASLTDIELYNKGLSNFQTAKIYVVDTIAKIIYIEDALLKYKDNIFGFEIGANKLSYNFATSIEPRDKSLLVRYYYDEKDLSVGFLKNFIICRENNTTYQQDPLLTEEEISPF